MSKRGTTLVESVIAIFITSVVVLTFLESLNVGMTGTLQLTRKTSAINIAQSQLEYVQSKTYNPSNGSLVTVYGLVTDPNASQTSDVINYNISGTVEFVNNSQSLQKITVNVSYMTGKQVQLIDYKTSSSNTTPLAKGWLVTDIIKDFPFLPAGGRSIFGDWYGFYHVFEVGTDNMPITATWNFSWTREFKFGGSLATPHMGIFNGTPTWASRNYLNVTKPDGIVIRPGTIGVLGGCFPRFPVLGGIGCCCPIGCPSDCAWPGNCFFDQESDAIIEEPSSPLDVFDEFFSYAPLLLNSGSYERTITSNTLPKGIYTIFFFNAEDNIDIKTNWASVSYYY